MSGLCVQQYFVVQVNNEFGLQSSCIDFVIGHHALSDTPTYSHNPHLTHHSFTHTLTHLPAYPLSTHTVALDLHLLACSRAGHVAAAETALARGARVNFRSVEELRSTPLLLACKNNRAEMVRLLLRKKAHLESTDDFGWTALMHAADRGLVNITKQLLRKGSDPNYLVPADGRHALSVAARQGRHKVATLLLEAGAEPDLRHTGDNYNALLEACHYGQVEVVRAILKYHVVRTCRHHFDFALTTGVTHNDVRGA